MKRGAEGNGGGPEKAAKGSTNGADLSEVVCILDAGAQVRTSMNVSESQAIAA